MNTETKVAPWTLISLRPRGQHAPLRRAAKAAGARVIALSPWALQACGDAATRATLEAALAAERVVFS
ncbi:MAG: uroporphyrinogen-III synthase, partial [Stenotrophomonas maltophilia]